MNIRIQSPLFDAATLEALQALPPMFAVLAAQPFVASATVSVNEESSPQQAAATAAQQLWSIVRDGGQVEWLPAAPDLSRPELAALLPDLAPQRPSANHKWVREAVATAITGNTVRDPVVRATLTAGLLQLNDWLEESHQASQSIEGEGRHGSGDYWHAIMHRREPDYGNARYWFRHVGRHPAMKQLPPMADEILSRSPAENAHDWLQRLTGTGSWDAFAFVDLCETAARQPGSSLDLAARQIQMFEMLNLLTFCWGER